MEYYANGIHVSFYYIYMYINRGSSRIHNYILKIHICRNYFVNFQRLDDSYIGEIIKSLLVV